MDKCNDLVGDVFSMRYRMRLGDYQRLFGIVMVLFAPLAGATCSSSTSSGWISTGSYSNNAECNNVIATQNPGWQYCPDGVGAKRCVGSNLQVKCNSTMADVCPAGTSWDQSTQQCCTAAADCTGQQGKYADCASNSCKDLPVPVASCNQNFDDAACTAGSDYCFNTVGGDFFSGKGECFGYPTKCTADKGKGSPGASDTLFPIPIPNFPEAGEPCQSINGVVVCGKNSPGAPAERPDDVGRQRNGQPLGGGGNDVDGDGQAEPSAGTGSGGSTTGYFYGGGGSGGSGSGSSGEMNCPDCAKEVTLQAIKDGLLNSPGTIEGHEASDLYSADEEVGTYEEIFQAFSNRMQGSSIGTAASGFYNVNLGGAACPVWTIPSVMDMPPIEIDMFCNATMEAIWPWISAVLLATATWFGFRIAVLT